MEGFKMIKLVLVRHGQSMWNLENRFTGWTDVELSEQGIKEAKEAIEKCINDKTASISYLRRKFKIGDSRAGRIIDQMENMGIISAAVGNKAREVLVTPYTWEQIKDKFVSGEASHVTESRKCN